MIERRELLGSAAVLAALSVSPVSLAKSSKRPDIGARLSELEGEGRLGVYILDTKTGEFAGHRTQEHFAMCSTFKLPLVAGCLRAADAGRLDLEEILPYGPRDLLEWAPVTGPNVDRGGLPIRTLLQAAQEVSDGVAANLLVRRLGGPTAVTAMFRDMGDAVTRLDRYEPMLGMVLSADLRDTTTPRAMAELVTRITTGSILTSAARTRLLDWMVATATGTKRLRAGLPAEWRSGNKTGTGRAPGTTNKCNDIAITFPPGKAPVIIAAYYDSGVYTDQIEDWQQAVLAKVGRIASEWAMA